MSVKHKVHEHYKKVKYSKRWQTNRLLAAIYPLFRLAVAMLIFVYQKVYLPFKRSHPGRTIRSLKARVINKIVTLDFSSNTFKLARICARANRWPAARQAYGLALEREYKRKKPRPEYINEARFNLSVINRLLNIAAYKEQIKKHKKANTKPRIAIYTAIAGDYDTIKLPEVLLPNADYFLFTDKPVHDLGIFKVKPLPYHNIDTPRMTRYVKTHPHQLLPGYDLAIWIDANILIAGDISPLISGFIRSKKAIGAVPHPVRKTVHEEAEACILRNKEDGQLIKEQVNHYRELGYNTNELIESNIMMFDLKSKKLPDFFTTWWSEIDKYTRRDQLSLNYSLDKSKIRWHRIMKHPQNARNHPLFALVPHHVKQNSVAALNQALGSKIINPYAGPSFALTKKEVLKDQLDRKIDVIYCVHNALPDVKLCLASVAKHRKNPNLKLIIIDDGSDSPTANFLQKFQKKHGAWAELHRKETGSGYTRAANRGLKASSGELVILLNSDTIVTDGWSEKMAAAVFSTPGAGIVGPLSSAASHQSIPNHIGVAGKQTATNDLPDGLSADDINKHCEEWSVAGFYPLVPLVHGFCFGLTREAINKVGYFDEKSFPYGYGEENDYCFRATDAGLGLVIATNTYIFHAKSKSYADDRRVKLMKAGNEKLRSLRGKERITRSVKSVLTNPQLQKFRDNAFALYKKYER